MRLDKYLADLQIGTRSQVKNDIKKGQVTVNGEIIKKADCQINEKADRICYQGRELCYQKFQYYMLHKPQGVVTATRDNHDKTVLDLLPKDSGKDLFPVGRLDKDTEGLLLITNDGELAHNLLSPRKHVEKKYYARCEGKITPEKIRLLEQGVDIGDETCTLPAKVTVLSEEKDFCCIELTITEGRFHQVKRMIQAVDANVVYLKRLSMGPLFLDEKLGKGEYRALTEEELKQLQTEGA